MDWALVPRPSDPGLSVIPTPYHDGMEMPTAHELNTDPAGSLRRLRGIRADMEAAEMTAIAAWMRRGGNLSGLAVRVGVSRQALNQRMQRKLKTREPAVTLRNNANADLAAQAHRQRDEIEEILRERDRRRAATAQ